jgi:hypothetical protein
MTEPRKDWPPTLPLPPLWRLLVGGAIIVAFLYFLYDWEKRKEVEPATPAATTGEAR